MRPADTGASERVAITRASRRRMRRTIAYAVASAGRDIYSAMTRISLASIRATNPSMQVWLCCDHDSEIAMRACADPLLEEVDQVIVCATPRGGQGFRSRFLRTRLRSMIDGPFLYLDSDILVRDDLSDIFTIRSDIAAAANRSKTTLAEQIWILDGQWLAAMGWRAREDVYVNAGVLFFQDTRPARALGEDWHKKWLASCKRGLSFGTQPGFRDQPALNSALAEIEADFHVLPRRFNAQFRAEPLSIPGACMWHYYQAKETNTAFEMLAIAVQKGEPLFGRRVKRIIRSPHPWRRDPPYLLGKGRRLIPRSVRRCLKPMVDALDVT
jgi:hypothetical protein